MSVQTADQASSALESALSELKGSLTCAVCQGVFVSAAPAVLLFLFSDFFNVLQVKPKRADCGHVFCSGCIQKALEGKSECPLCRSVSPCFFLCVLCALLSSSLRMSRKTCLAMNAMDITLDFSEEFATLTIMLCVFVCADVFVSRFAKLEEQVEATTELLKFAKTPTKVIHTCVHVLSLVWNSADGWRRSATRHSKDA